MTLFTPNYAWPYPELSDPPNGPSQDAALALAIDTQLKTVDTAGQAATAALAVLNGPLTAYTPTFTMQTANGVASGGYWQAGKIVYVEALFAASAGVSLGTGTITFSLPFTAAVYPNWQGAVVFGGGNGYVLPCTATSGGTTATIYGFSNAASGQITTPGSAGVVFASGHYISATLWYRKA